MEFKERYGPWALVAGASQGIGRAFAERIATAGVNCVLVSRSAAPLAELAADLAARYGVDCIAIAADLSAAEGQEAMLAAMGEREIGLFVHNAGADAIGAKFFDTPLSEWLQLADLNVEASMRLCHAVGVGMIARRKGGIVLVGSGAGYGGSRFTSIYSGAKAFQMCLAEGLWSELQPHEVDVLFCALGPTDTPAFRDLLGRKNVPVPPGLAEPDAVADAVLANLRNGPVFNWGQSDEDAGFLTTSAAQRRKRVQMVDAGSKRIFGE